jgi:ABC-type multidrug transport system fused ATPase/permease subunit
MGLLYGEVVRLLLRLTQECNVDSLPPPEFNSCEKYWDGVAADMQYWSFQLVGYLVLNSLFSISGSMITSWGFGTASERLSKRLRDSVFSAAVRQEVAFFDQRNVGSITSQLQQDATEVHNLTGEPVRSLVIELSSVLIGIGLSFFVGHNDSLVVGHHFEKSLILPLPLSSLYTIWFMWPFALVSLGTLPLVATARIMFARSKFGVDEGCAKNSDGGIVYETLVNIRTVFAFSMEEQRFQMFREELESSDPNHWKTTVKMGSMEGYIAMIVRLVNAIQFCWGGWLLFHYPNQFGFKDFINFNFAFVFAQFGLGRAFAEFPNLKASERAAGRLFYLLDRKSTIDPLSNEGGKPDP